MLEGQHISVRLGGQTIVRDLSFTLREGQWLMLVGPNGAGKSTLIRAVSQTLPYTGRVLLRGGDARRMKSADLARSIGVLAQQHSAEYAFSVEEVVSLGRYAYTSSPLSRGDPEGAARVEDALRLTGMAPLRRASVLTLSGGELQRTFLAQVFAQNPSILLLDEPANHLDLAYQRHIFSLVGDWLKVPGRAVLSVVHDLSLARLYGTHALLMSEGACVAQGETGSVLTPENLQAVYGMDVFAWMRGLLSQWAQEG